MDSIDLYEMRHTHDRFEVTKTYAAYSYYNNDTPLQRNDSIDPKPRTILSFLRDLLTKRDMPI